MAMTYANLTASIQEYAQNDSWGTTVQTDTIIRQAEERINQTIQIANYNTKSTTSTFAADVKSVPIADSDTAPIGPLYFKIRSGASTNPWSFLLLKDYNFLQEYAPVDSVTGTPKYYSFYNDTSDSNKPTFAFSPIADGTYTYEILYWFQPASIVTDTTGTWLSTHGETALLYGCLLEAYTFMKGEPDLMQLYDARYKEALQTLVASQTGSFKNSTYRDRWPRQSAQG